MKVDLRFPLSSTKSIPSDHAYQLLAAVSRIVPKIHDDQDVGIHPIRGRSVGSRQMELNAQSSLTLRTEITKIGDWLALSGQKLDLAGRTLRLGVPQVFPLVPAERLRSRLVTIKGFLDEETFTLAIRRQLEQLVSSPISFTQVRKRRTIRIKEKEIVGYELIIGQLTPEESLEIQFHGLGGRRHLGCGIFVPYKGFAR